MKNLTSGLGAVRLTKLVGWKPAPGPEAGGPDSMFQDEGASMDVIGIGVSSRREMMAGKGARISPEKEKPVQFDG